MEKPLRLHLGAGTKHWPGWLNVDSHENAELRCDVRKLPLDDNTVDEIQAIHLFEHLPRWEAMDILTEWHRVLRPGGKLVLELPSFNRMMRLYQNRQLDDRQLKTALYGEPNYRDPFMCHMWAWSEDELSEEMVKAGFFEVRVDEPFFHVKVRDFRIEGTK